MPLGQEQGNDGEVKLKITVHSATSTPSHNDSLDLDNLTDLIQHQHCYSQDTVPL